MKELENLKEMYLDEIKKINKKGELTPADGEAAKKALYTGHIGDGKIFVYSLDNVVKIRTGEEGAAALADVE